MSGSLNHVDRLGSVRAMTDAAGAVTATFRTDEFGVPTSSTGSSTQPYRFTGEPLDATGLQYLRSRYYDAELGRFLTRDTFAGSTADPATLHRYAYVGNRPTTLSDPTGHCWPLCFAAVGALIGAAVGTVAYAVTTPPSDWSVGGVAGAALGGGIAGAFTAVAGPAGATAAGIVGASTTGATAAVATIAIGATGGVIGTNVDSYLSTGHLASPEQMALAGTLNGFGGWFAGKLFPMKGVITAAQAPYFAPHTFGAFFGDGLNATAFRWAATAGAFFSEFGRFLEGGEPSFKRGELAH